MPVHLMHLSKTGGSAIKNTIRAVMRTQDLEPLQTPYGPLKLHGHMWRLHRLGPGKQQKVVFVVRDPVSRFGSGFYSRLRQGRPLMDNPWSEGERVAFESFKTPQQLGQALAGDGPDRAKAVFAMENINHLRWPQVSWLGGSVDALRERRSHVLYIGRQESLDDDWVELRSMLELPDSMVLPTDDRLAHRGNTEEDRSLTDEAAAAVREWYAEDYRLIEYCEEIRSELLADRAT